MSELMCPRDGLRCICPDPCTQRAWCAEAARLKAQDQRTTAADSAAQQEQRNGQPTSSDQGLPGTVSGGNRADERNQGTGRGVGRAGGQVEGDGVHRPAVAQHRGDSPTRGADGSDASRGATDVLLTPDPSNADLVRRLQQYAEEMHGIDEGSIDPVSETYEGAMLAAAARISADAETIRGLREALRSIAANTCCERCQEAALVARAALAQGEG